MRASVLINRRTRVTGSARESFLLEHFSSHRDSSCLNIPIAYHVEEPDRSSVTVYRERNKIQSIRDAKLIYYRGLMYEQDH